jgi:hypothetical protein
VPSSRNDVISLHNVGAGPDRVARERAHVTAVLAERVLVAARDVRPVGALAARVDEHDHDVGAGGRAAHQPAHLARRAAPRHRHRPAAGGSARRRGQQTACRQCERPAWPAAHRGGLRRSRRGCL